MPLSPTSDLCSFTPIESPKSLNIIYLFFFNQLFFFSHITQHSIQNITKQNNRHILNISKSSQKGGRERGKDNKNTKVTLPYNHVYPTKNTAKHQWSKAWPHQLARCTFTSHYLQEATDPICFSTHVRCKPVLYYCLLRSCKTSKQHSLLH